MLCYNRMVKDFLSNSLFHSTKGRYFTDTKVVGVDFIANLFREGDTISTQIHETGHVFLCNNTEMGLFYSEVEKNVHKFTQLSDEQQKNMANAIFYSQQMVQEGYSTYIQFALLKKKLTNQEQVEWLRKVPDSYRRWVRPFLFSLKLPIEQRNRIGDLVNFAMNTHVRKDAEKYQLLDNDTQLKEYLNDENNNPSIRMKKMLRIVKNNPNLLNGDINDIPKLSGISFFQPVEKKDIAAFINYLGSKTGLKIKITEEQIGDAPTIDKIFSHVQDNTLVANLNLNLAENADYLFKSADVIHYKDIIERIIVINHDEKNKISVKKLQDLSREKFDEEPELTLILQTTTGEKYLYSTSVAKATQLLNNELSQAVLGVKFGDYNLREDEIYSLPAVRPPDLVIFNHYWQMSDFLVKAIKNDGKTNIDFCHIGFGMLSLAIAKIRNKNPLLTVNLSIPSQAGKIAEAIKGNSNQFTSSFIQKNKKQLNSHLILWSGLDHRGDWVQVLLEESRE